MHDFRLQPIMDIAHHAAAHGYELLAGARQRPKWTRMEWRDWYENLPIAVRDRTPLDERIFLNINSEQACDPHIVYAINQAITYRECIIEWTEDVATQSTYERALRQFRTWRDCGVEIAVDDIGAGQDGIGRALAALPNYAKLDCAILRRSREVQPSFLRGLREILEGIGCKVIIEGIETPADLLYVRNAGFQYVQGFLYPSTQKLAALESAADTQTIELEQIAMWDL
jgi:EAL domain-containing protein (putative c-di-GMP-specific phosphodiesterase class I)